MKSFLLFLAAVVALFIFLANLGPLILFAAGVFLLYVIYKQFIKTDSTAARVMWVILGLVVLSITLPNIFALIGVLALYFLYVLFKKDNGSDTDSGPARHKNDDPFTNFERQWADMKK